MGALLPAVFVDGQPLGDVHRIEALNELCVLSELLRQHTVVSWNFGQSTGFGFWYIVYFCDR